METTYKLSKKWKTTFIVLGVLCCLLVVLAPFGIVMFVVAAKARISIADDALRVWWLGKRTIPWNDFEAIGQGTTSVHGLGAVGALAGAALIKGPIRYKQKSRKTWGNIAVHWHERPQEIVQQLQQRTGLQLGA